MFDRPNPFLTRVLFFAALTALALAFRANAADAVVGRASNANVRERVVALVNEARSRARRCGSERFAPAAPLRVSKRLNEAAVDHARDMARHNFFEHEGSDGSQPKERVLRAGYKPRISGE